MTHRQSRYLLESETGDVHAEEHQRDGHRGGRGLHNHCHQCTHDDKQQDGEERVLWHMGQHARHHVADVHRRGSLLQERQSHEQEREAEDELAHALAVALAAEDERHADGKQGDGKGCNVHLEAHCRDNPCRHRRTDVGTHDDTYRLCQCHQSGIHKTHYHHRGGTRRLDECRDEHTRQHTHHAVFRHRCQDAAQAVARKLLQALRHGLHAEEKQCQRTDERENVDNQFHYFLFFATKVSQSCYTTVTLMLQSCYKRRRNRSIILLTHYCNMLRISLQCQPLTVGKRKYEKRKSRKNPQNP